MDHSLRDQWVAVRTVGINQIKSLCCVGFIPQVVQTKGLSSMINDSHIIEKLSSRKIATPPSLFMASAPGYLMVFPYGANGMAASNWHTKIQTKKRVFLRITRLANIHHLCQIVIRPQS